MLRLKRSFLGPPLAVSIESNYLRIELVIVSLRNLCLIEGEDRTLSAMMSLSGHSSR